MPDYRPDESANARTERRLDRIAGVVALVILIAIVLFCAWLIRSFQWPLAP